MNTSHQFRLEIRIEGQSVGSGRFDAADLGAMLGRLQQAVSRVGELLYGESSSQGRGRKKQEIEQLCRLQLVDWRAGSAVSVLELGRPSAQLALFRHIGEDSVKALVAGITELDAPSKGGHLPPGWDAGVVESVRGLTDKMGKSYEKLTFHVAALPQPLTAVLDTRKRQAVSEWLEMPPREEGRTVIGRLEDLLGHNRRVARLYEPDNTVWECYFDEAHDRELADNWLGLVAVEGKAVIEGEKRSLVVTGPVRRVGSSVESAEYGDFWRSLPFAELARRQGAQPISDFASWLDSLPAIPEEDADGFYAQLTESREERRKLERRGARG